MAYEVPLGSKAPCGRESCVDYVERLGTYIKNHADMIVGDIERVRAININFKLEVDCIPTMKVERETILDIKN